MATIVNKLTGVTYDVVRAATPTDLHRNPTIASRVILTRNNLPPTSRHSLSPVIWRYLWPEQVQIKELEEAIFSTVLVLRDENSSHGSTGTIIKHKDSKYFVMACHSLVDRLQRNESEEIFYTYRQPNGSIKTHQLKYSDLVCYVKPPDGDVAIFKYKGEIEGARLANPPQEGHQYKSFAIGYPRCFVDEYTNHGLSPLLSYGFATSYRAVEIIDEDVDSQVLKKFSTKECNVQLSRIIFSGLTTAGNSGGGLFDLNGELMGICYGSIYVRNQASLWPRLFLSIQELLEGFIS